MKNGFTLAEVLITLGVIGVVAAMTIPTVINHHKERVTINKVKKIYSTISQALLLSIKDNGPANEWNVGNGYNSTTAVEITIYLKPYLKVLKDCGTASGCLEYTQNAKYLKGDVNDTNYDTNSKYYKMILQDGSYIWIRSSDSLYCNSKSGGHSDSCGVVFFDINGNKQPNTIGIDIFDMHITPYSVKPSLASCDKNSEGWGCLNYILQNDNMNYLH